MRLELHRSALGRFSLAYLICTALAGSITAAEITVEPSAAAAAPTSGIWLSQAEIMTLPTSGRAWDQLKDAADESFGSANISDNESDHDVWTMAAALVYARTNDSSYRTKAADAIDAAIGTEAGGNTLALSRNLLGYVVAADLIDLASQDPAADQRFRSWLSSVRTRELVCIAIPSRPTTVRPCSLVHPDLSNWAVRPAANMARPSQMTGAVNASRPKIQSASA